jgi:predicted dehydrogenase
MRAVIISYSHHGANLGRAAQSLGHVIVGAFDPSEEARERLGREFHCPVYSDLDVCLTAVNPDVALVAGRHVEMPGYVGCCVQHRIPYLIDKPFADCAARLRPAVEASVRQRVFSALILPNRKKRFTAVVNRMLADGTLGTLTLFASRLNNGPPTRYDGTPSAWHNDPAVSGGGCWVVEAAHGLDLLREFVGPSRLHVVGAVLSNTLHRRPIEDSALGLFRSETGVTGVIETGYTYPPGLHHGDHQLRAVGSKATVLWRNEASGPGWVEIHTMAGIDRLEEVANATLFRDMVADALDALVMGVRPAATIQTALQILEIQDAVLDFARRGVFTNGPYPMASPASYP